MIGDALLFIATLLAAGALSAAPGGVAHPQLRLVDTFPLTVKGSGFRSREHVRVVYVTTTAHTFVQRRRATPTGAFWAAFTGVVFDPCEARRLYAVGSLGSTAVLRLPRPACQPA